MFFRWTSAAGEARQFRFAYRGGEPVAGPHPHDSRADLRNDVALDPLALARAYEAGLKVAQGANALVPQANSVVHAGDVGMAAARAAPAPRYAPEVQKQGGDALYRGDNLPGGQGIRPEYQNSGQWIGRPGT